LVNNGLIEREFNAPFFKFAKSELNHKEKKMIAQTKQATPNAKNTYEVSEFDVPVHCPMPGTSLWDSHPQVFIAFDKKGDGKCPYCGAQYHIK